MKETNQKNRWGVLFPALTWALVLGYGGMQAQNCGTINNVVTTIANAASSNEHAIKVTWTAVNGASQYQIQASTDGSNFGPSQSSSTNSFVFESPSTPNTAYWFRVRMQSNEGTCDWTTTTEPMYTSAALPSDLIATYNGTGIELVLRDETPFTNPTYTEYAVHCTTNNKYIQADGSFGTAPYYAPKSDWTSIFITGTTENTSYCFSSRVRNEDGNVRKAMGNAVLPTQSFNSNNLTNGGTAGTSTWFAPSSNSPIVWTANGNCSGGAIGFSGNWNNFWSNFLRLPEQNLNGLDTFTTSFTLTHSYAANAVNNYFRFYIWADNGYKNVVSKVTIDGETITTDNYGKFFFNRERTCATVEVTFNLATIANRSSVLIYLEAHSAYNNSTPFSFYIDELTVSEGEGTVTTCVTTTLGVDQFHNTVSVYPNPTTSTLTVQTQEEIKNLTVYNLLGQKVAEQTNASTITIAPLATGHYMLEVTLANGTITTKKIVKQ
jgi:hypothetical protein